MALVDVVDIVYVQYFEKGNVMNDENDEEEELVAVVVQVLDILCDTRMKDVLFLEVDGGFIGLLPTTTDRTIIVAAALRFGENIIILDRVTFGICSLLLTK